MNISELHERLRLAGEAWADADAAATILEETKKSVLSQLMQKYPGQSNAAAEAKAYADPVYIEHLNTMVEKRKEANKCRVRYDSARMYVELMRTEAATRRAEMGLK